MRVRRRKVKWNPGDIFTIELPDGTRCIGQALGIMGRYINVVNCTFFDIKFKEGNREELSEDKLIAVISTTRDLLDDGVWAVIGNEPVFIGKENWPNEQFADKNYVGSKTYGSGIVNKFLAAYYGLFSWNGYHDPNYFDKLLISPDIKPSEDKLMFEEKTAPDFKHWKPERAGNNKREHKSSWPPVLQGPVEKDKSKKSGVSAKKYIEQGN